MTAYKDYGYQDDQAAHTFAYLINPLLATLGAPDSTCVLDVGCGNGYLVNFLLSKGHDAFGTDASQKGIAIASKTNPGRFFVQDLSTGKLPPELQQQRFDIIMAIEVIEHLYDPETFLTFCKQQLPPNGHIIISTPYHGYLKNLILSLLNKWDDHLNPMWIGGHIKFWSKTSLSRALTNAGFEVVQFKGCGRLPFFWKSMLIKARKN